MLLAQKAIRDGLKTKVEAVMGAYNRTNGEPCCASEELIGEILRRKVEIPGSLCIRLLGHSRFS